MAGKARRKETRREKTTRCQARWNSATAAEGETTPPSATVGAQLQFWSEAQNPVTPNILNIIRRASSEFVEEFYAECVTEVNKTTAPPGQGDKE